MANIDMRNMPDHYPHRDDQVEAWIKERRDEYKPYNDPRESGKWSALDNLLDEYRLAADTGQSLEEVVNGELDPPSEPRMRKPKREG